MNVIRNAISNLPIPRQILNVAFVNNKRFNPFNLKNVDTIILEKVVKPVLWKYINMNSSKVIDIPNDYIKEIAADDFSTLLEMTLYTERADL